MQGAAVALKNSAAAIATAAQYNEIEENSPLLLNRFFDETRSCFLLRYEYGYETEVAHRSGRDRR